MSSCNCGLPCRRALVISVPAGLKSTHEGGGGGVGVGQPGSKSGGAASPGRSRFPRRPRGQGMKRDHARAAARSPGGVYQPIGGGILGQPIGFSIAGVAPSGGGIAGESVRGLTGLYAGPTGLPYHRQAIGLAMGPCGGFGYGAAGTLGDARVAGTLLTVHGQAPPDGLHHTLTSPSTATGAPPIPSAP